MIRKLLLVCGILSPLLYAVADWSAGMRWEGYSFRDQTISELGAIGAPTKQFFSLQLMVVYLLLTAFGIGTWRTAVGQRSVRVVGGLTFALGVMALTVGMFVPMQLRGIEQGLTGALHLIEGGLAVVMILLAIGFAASAFGKHFRFYSIVTIFMVLAFGAWSGTYAPLIEQDLPTPWLGVIEPIFWYAYQLWFAVLALMLLRQDSRLE